MIVSLFELLIEHGNIRLEHVEEDNERNSFNQPALTKLEIFSFLEAYSRIRYHFFIREKSNDNRDDDEERSENS